MKRKLGIACGTLAPAVLLLIGARCSPGFSDWLANSVSRPASAMLNRLTSLTSVPVGEALFLLLALLLVSSVLRAALSSIRRRSGMPLKQLGCNVLMAGGILILCFSVLWTPLLHGHTLFDVLGYDADAKYTLSELTELCYDLTDDANALEERQSGAATAQEDLLAQVEQALPAVDGIPLTPARAKQARYPELFEALGIAGIYCPFTGEAIYNPNELSLSLPYLVTHESAHQAGYAREDEANYIAYLACREGDVRFQYSGAMYALYYAMEALHDSDTMSWTAARLRMSKAVQRDYYRMNGLRNAEESGSVRLRRTAEAAFLTITRQQGARSYGDMVDLLLAERRAPMN